jgi:hypothetical protein
MKIKRFNKNKEKRDTKEAHLKIVNQLPQDLLEQISVLLQDSDTVSISPNKLTRPDWIRINDKVKEMGGVWVSHGQFNHWSIPLAWTRYRA